MGEILFAKMEPLPFLPPWLYLSLVAAVLVGWLIRELIVFWKNRYQKLYAGDFNRLNEELVLSNKQRGIMKMCLSCGAPLSEEFAGPTETFCKYCTDADGNLKTREEVKQGIAFWLKEWQPNLSDDKALDRADFYMKAMPEWAD